MDDEIYSTKKSKKVSLLSNEQGTIVEANIPSSDSRRSVEPTSFYPPSSSTSSEPSSQTTQSIPQSSTTSKWKIHPMGVYYQRMKNIFRSMTS